jgi:hypothetical protein
VKIIKELNRSELILVPKDIENLAELVYDEYTRDIEENEDAVAQFFLEDAHRTKYSCDNLEIFQETDILESKRVTSILMDFTNFDRSERIHICLKHQQSVQVIVSGKDERWVNGVMESIESRFSDCRKPEMWPHKWRWPLTLLFSFGIGLLIINSFEIIVNRRVADFSPLFSKFPFNLYLSLTLGFIPASHIVDKMRRLYPSFELITGPEHTRTEEKKRKSLHKLIWLGFVPLLISISIQLAMRFFHF